MSEDVSSRRGFLKASSAAAAGAVLGSADAASTAETSPAAGAGAFEGGDLKGRFVYDGVPPARKPVEITADREFCGKQNILKENLVVNPVNRGIANVVVWLYQASREAPPPVHPSYRATEKAEVHLDCRGCRFDPHVCVLRTTQTLLIRNLNPIGDSAKIDTLSNPPINILVPVDGRWRQTYSRPERLPAPVSCSLHPWESAWLLVVEHPYVAASDADGNFVIKSLPVGRRLFQFWHEQPGYLTEVKHRGSATTWRRGRVEMLIKPGENDLGELRLAPPLFVS